MLVFGKVALLMLFTICDEFIVD